MVKYVKIGGLYFYVSNVKLKARSGKTRSKAEKRMREFLVIKKIAESNTCNCEICGEEKKLQMHHLLAESIYPEKALDPHNTILVCEQCHTRIHNDPFLWCDLIKTRISGAASKVEAIIGNPPYKI